MKVGLIVPGGVDRSGTHRVIPFLLWLIERLAREHEVHVVALNQEPRPCVYDLLGARVHNVGSRPRRPRAVATVIREHRRGAFDVLHAFWAAPPGVVAAVAGRLLSVPVMLQSFGGDLESMPEIGFGLRSYSRGRLWLRAAVAGAARVMVSSEFTVGRAEALGIVAERLPLGVSIQDWPPREPVRREAGEPVRLLHVATLNPVKDQATLLRAVSLLSGAYPDLHLDVVGEDISGGEVQRLAESLGLSDRVTFHGFQPHSVLRGLVERAHVALVSSRHECGPLVLLEAAVAGVPTVGTSVGHIVSWSPEAAVAVPVGDHEALASAAQGLLMDEDRRMRVARAAQRLALEEDADWSAARVVEHYHELQQSSS
ncbi:MAG: glycosyltransferase family 4 protein [Gemmatimonadetes bacterium]|nr:glycosyltransferase family 4 protein [Gemmatimonadota bacterium]